MDKHLVLMDTDKIQKYIFSTNKLKLIRGASSLLTELNKKETVQNRVESKKGIFIFAGGGQIMAKFNSANEAQEYIRAEKAIYEKSEASITGILEKYGDSFENVVKKAQVRLKREKEERTYGKQILSNPFFKTCQQCGINPASKTKVDKFICNECYGKIEMGENIRRNPGKSPIYARFLAFLNGRPEYQKWKKAMFTDDLSELGKLSKPENYLGLICADGNRMGARLFSRKSENEYKELSDAIREDLQESVFESLLKYIPEPFEGKIPFDFVIMGGDDLIIITPAEKAIPIALEILEQFEKKTVDIAEKIGDKKFTLSAGVVIAHSKYPISQFTQRGDELLESAKKLNKEKWYGVERGREDISTIDYLVINTPSANTVEHIRDNDFTYTEIDEENTYKLTQRPFSLQKAHKITDIVKRLKKSGLSRSRLYSISDSLFKGKNQSILTILSLITRLKGDDKKIEQLFMEMRTEKLFYQDIRLFPWNIQKGHTKKYDTPFLDILEIYDFIDGEC